MLTKQLRELESCGLVDRNVYPEIRARVEYSLSEAGRSLEPVVRALQIWGEAHVARRKQSDDALLSESSTNQLQTTCSASVTHVKG